MLGLTKLSPCDKHALPSGPFSVLFFEHLDSLHAPCQSKTNMCSNVNITIKLTIKQSIFTSQRAGIKARLIIVWYSGSLIRYIA